MQDYIVAIPARYASTRLPGKPLVDIEGIPMIKRVCMQAKQSNAKRIIVCVDNEKVASVLEDEKDVEVCMTPVDAKSGTDRIAYMIKTMNLDEKSVIVNIQGDEPLINPEHINLVAKTLIDKNADMASLCAKIDNYADVFNPNMVKVVMDSEMFALYFSRAPIPYERDYFGKGEEKLHFNHYHHIGIYAYKAKTVTDFLSLPQSHNEQCEMLEQLRLMHYGYKIAMAIIENPPLRGVDTKEDLEAVRAIFRQQAR